MIRKFKHVEERFRKYEQKGVIPSRGTSGSAGYDFQSPISIVIPPYTTQVIWSNVKASMSQNEVLMIHVRSSIGIKKGLMLANGTGIIDSDYFENKSNDGNIGIPLYNYTNKPVSIERGDRIAQGIFTNFLVADNDIVVSDKRTGGIGSTGI